MTRRKKKEERPKCFSCGKELPHGVTTSCAVGVFSVRIGDALMRAVHDEAAKKADLLGFMSPEAQRMFDAIFFRKSPER
jgi:hypothetical protein